MLPGWLILQLLMLIIYGSVDIPHTQLRRLAVAAATAETRATCLTPLPHCQG